MVSNGYMNISSNKIENEKAGAPDKLEARAENKTALVVAALVLCLLLSLAARVHFSRFGITDPEQFHWLIQARDAVPSAEGRPTLAPLHPALIAIPVKLGADPEAAAVWVSLLTGALTAVPVFLAAFMLLGLASAVLASVIFAFLPLSLAVAGQLSAESTWAFLMMAALAAMIFDARRPSPARMVLVAAVCGLAPFAYSTGGIGLLFIAALINHAVSAAAGKRRPGKMMLALGAGAVVFLAFVFARGYWPSSPAATGGLDFPPLMSLAPAGFFVLAFMGAIFLLTQVRKKARLELALVLWLLAGGVLFSGSYSDPFVVPLIFGLCIIGGGAAGLLRSVIVRAQSSRQKIAVAVMAFFVSALVAHFLYSSRKDAGYYRNLMTHRAGLLAGRAALAKEAREFMAVKPGAKVCSLDPLFAYYFEGRPASLARNLEAVKEQVGGGACDLVAVDSMTVWRKAPALRPLLTGRAELPGAELGFLRRPPGRELLAAVYEAGAMPSPLPSLPARASPEQLQKQSKLAEQFYRRGYLETARKLYESVLEQRPDRETRRMLIHVNIALGYYDGEGLDQAEQLLREFALLDPDDPQLNDYRRTIRLLRLKSQAIWAGR